CSRRSNRLAGRAVRCGDHRGLTEPDRLTGVEVRHVPGGAGSCEGVVVEPMRCPHLRSPDARGLMNHRSNAIRALTLASAGLLWSIMANTAHAESCTRSREYILNGLAGDLAQTPQSYQSLFKICMATIELSNIKDAFLLRDGGIGAIAKRD